MVLRRAGHHNDGYVQGQIGPFPVRYLTMNFENI